MGKSRKKGEKKSKKCAEKKTTRITKNAQKCAAQKCEKKLRNAPVSLHPPSLFIGVGSSNFELNRDFFAIFFVAQNRVEILRSVLCQAIMPPHHAGPQLFKCKLDPRPLAKGQMHNPPSHS